MLKGLNDLQEISHSKKVRLSLVDNFQAPLQLFSMTLLLCWITTSDVGNWIQILPWMTLRSFQFNVFLLFVWLAEFALLFGLLFIFLFKPQLLDAIVSATFSSAKSKWLSTWLWSLNSGRQSILPFQWSWNKINSDIFIHKKCDQEETQ